MKSFSIAAVVTVALTGLSGSAIAEQKQDPDPEQELFNDCFEKAKNTGQFSDGEATRMCVKMVAKVFDDEDQAKPLQGFKLKKKRSRRIITKRPRIRTNSSRY